MGSAGAGYLPWLSREKNSARTSVDSCCKVVFSAMRTEVHTIVHNGPHTSTLDGRTIHDGYCATFSKKIVRGMQKNIGVIFLKQNNDRAADDTDDGY